MLIQFLFWVALVLCVGTAGYDFAVGRYKLGLLVLVLGPIVARLFAEGFILFFRVNDTLTEIRNLLAKKKHMSRPCSRLGHKSIF